VPAPPDAPVNPVRGVPLATRLELTEVHEDTAGEVFMAAPGPQWREIAREEHEAAGDDPPYAFVAWERAD